MKHKYPLIAVVMLLLAAGIGGSLWVMRPQDSAQVEIVQDGAVLWQLDLAQEENRAFPVEYA